jgi:hypothetical protein
MEETGLTSLADLEHWNNAEVLGFSGADRGADFQGLYLKYIIV